MADVQLAARRHREFEHSPDLRRARLVADAWCAAFVAPKTSAVPPITQATLLRLGSEPLPAMWGVSTFGGPDVFASAEASAVVEISDEYKFFHWHLEFPQVFRATEVPDGDGPGWEGGFSCVLGNPPWETLSPDTREFFGSVIPEIRTLSKAEKTQQIDKFLRIPQLQRQWAAHQRRLFAIAHFLKRSGRYRMYAPGNLGKGDFNVYRSFAELALTFTRPGGYVGQIVQSGLYAGANASAIRRALIEECTWIAVYGFDNKGGSWFPGVTLENFAAYVAKIGDPAPFNHEIRAAFGLPSPRTMASDLVSRELEVSIEDVKAQNPETLAIPDIRDPCGARVSLKISRAWLPFGADSATLPMRDFCREIDMSDKNGVFSEDADGLPVYEGRMIDFFDHRAKRYVSGHGNTSVWEETPFGSPHKTIRPQWRVDKADLANVQVRERTATFRIGFMDVADPGRQRSFVSALIPPNVICGDKVPTLRFPNAEWYTPIYLAVANSLIIDFMTRQRVMSKKMALNIVDSLPIARLGQADQRSRWLAGRSLQLTCTSREMTPFWNVMAEAGWVDHVADDVVPGECDPERRSLLRAEIDAFVARALYDLSESELSLVIDSFVQLQRIEQKRHGEFRTKRLVLDAYRRLRSDAALDTPSALG